MRKQHLYLTFALIVFFSISARAETIPPTSPSKKHTFLTSKKNKFFRRLRDKRMKRKFEEGEITEEEYQTYLKTGYYFKKKNCAVTKPKVQKIDIPSEEMSKGMPSQEDP